MLTIQSSAENLPEANFKEKVRCGEVYRNLNGNEMFQKFYYRCLECSMDFESSPEFEEHVIVHYLQEDVAEHSDSVDNLKKSENVISISSDEDEEENDYLYAFEVASLVEGNVSENDLPLPLMQMLSEPSADSCDKTVQLNSESDDEDEEEKNIVFPCEGLRKQALHVFSEHCCTQCPAYFSTKSELIFHLHVHTLPNTVVCPHCYEAFPNILKLNEHSSSMKRKRFRKAKNKETRDKITENLQSCKKAKNQIKGDSLEPQDQREDNTNHCTSTYGEKEDTESSLNCEWENGAKNTLIQDRDKIATDKKDENCRNDSDLNVSIPRKNHISNDT